MKLGACLGWGDFSKYEFAKQCGLDYGETDFTDIALASEEDFNEFCENIEKLGLPVLASNHFLPGHLKLVGENVDKKALAEFLEKGLKRASALGIQSVVFGSGAARSFKEDYSIEEANKDMVVFLKEIASPIASKYDVNIVIEPLSIGETSMIHTVKDGVDFAQKADFNHVYGLADLFHVCNNKDDIDGIGDFVGKIKHAHIAEPETRIFPNKNADDSVNEIYKRFISALEKAGCETLTIEARTDDFFKDLPEAIEVLREVLSAKC
ncbi:MAG: sugar phosphate isomerase/epimerase [Ruminococcaceae bacterium]|nr:sugar phosphate isomerase/epimerase [Oscillospiraceae bacterium]